MDLFGKLAHLAYEKFKFPLIKQFSLSLYILTLVLVLKALNSFWATIEGAS